MLLTIASTFGFTFFLVIVSIIIINARYPSNAGNGNKLINPTFTDKYASRYISPDNPALLCCPTIEYIPTGPDKAFTLTFPVISALTVINMVLKSEPNLSTAYFNEGAKPYSFLSVNHIP